MTAYSAVSYSIFGYLNEYYSVKYNKFSGMIVKYPLDDKGDCYTYGNTTLTFMTSGTSTYYFNKNLFSQFNTKVA